MRSGTVPVLSCVSQHSLPAVSINFSASGVTASNFTSTSYLLVIAYLLKRKFIMASLEGFEPTTRCLEVIQRAWFLLTLKLNCYSLPIPVLASKPPFFNRLYNTISAKLVPTFCSSNHRSRRGIAAAPLFGLRPHSLCQTRVKTSLFACVANMSYLCKYLRNMR